MKGKENEGKKDLTQIDWSAAKLRSRLTMTGRRMAGARALWRANGMKPEMMGRPVIAVVNSFSQFVPGHTHLHEVGQFVKSEIEKSGCYAAEFSTIAIDDGIAMGHDGMLYSLPSRDLIADSVEYVVNAHRADAMVCISNCDKITPGMLMAAMRLNIPAIFVSGGPMEAGRVGDRALDLVSVMVDSADESLTDEEVEIIEQSACPGCGSCSGMFTANSMNCLTEALGLSLPGNGTIVATHENRLELFRRAARQIVVNCDKYYNSGDDSVLPRNIACRDAVLNAMALDIAMGGSTNTVLHLLAVAAEAGTEFSMSDIDRLSRRCPVLCKVSPNSEMHIEDVNRAGGVMTIMGRLVASGVLNLSVGRVDGLTLGEAVSRYSVEGEYFSEDARKLWLSAPSGNRNASLGTEKAYYATLDTDTVGGCIRDVDHACAADGGIAVLYGNIARDGCVVKTAGVAESILKFKGLARVYESQDEAVRGILSGEVKAGEVVVIIYEGPKGGPGMQEMLYPTSYLKSRHLGSLCALITDGRFSGGTSGLSVGHISPEAAAGGDIALVRTGDEIELDIPRRTINLKVSEAEMNSRRAQEEARGKSAFTPHDRKRKVSAALRAYAAMVSSADKGGVRLLPE